MSFPKKPDLALGVTYAPNARLPAKGADDEHKQIHGPDLPQTAAARDSVVSEEDGEGTSVIDRKTAKPVGPEMAHQATGRPDRPAPADE